MIAFDLIPKEVIYALGNTLVHTLWQGLVIALILLVALALVPKKNAQLKYWLAITALCAMVFWGGFTLQQEMAPLVSQASITVISNEPAANALQFAPVSWSRSTGFPLIQDYLNRAVINLQPYMHTLVVIWLLGMLVFLIRLQGSLIYLGRIRKVGVRSVPAAWQRKLKELSKQLGVRSCVALMESTLADIPMVIGHLKPVILIPAGMLTGLPAADVEAILAHELAHIKRFDYIINIVQTIVESVLFFNPAVWWVSRVIRKQREHSCDDLAVQCCGNQMIYAKALTNLGAWSIRTPVMSMSLFKSRGELFQRVKRLVYPQVRTSTVKERIIPGMVLLLTLILFTWYSHKVQAQWMPVKSPEASIKTIIPNPPEMSLVNMDTIPELEEVEELPPMEPTEPAEATSNLHWEEEFVDRMTDIVVDIPEIPDFDVHFDLDFADGLMDGGTFNMIMGDMGSHINDTTRQKIQKALEAQREVLAQASKEQAKALEKVREELRKTLDQARPLELTEQEWEMAKQQIRRAERSLERTMEQTERALQHALENKEQLMHLHWDQINRDLREKQHQFEEHMQRYEARNRERLEREIERKIKRVDGEAQGHRHQRNEDRLRNALVEDGLIARHDADLHLEFKKDQIKINGKRLEGSLKEKYRDLLDEIYGANSSGELEYKY